MKERFSKLLLTSALTVLLGTSVGVSANASDCCNVSCCEPVCCEDPCLSISADYLFWNICQEDVDVVLVDTVPAVDTFRDAETKFFDFEYKSGFRIAAAYRIPCECWSIEGRYTYFHPKNHQRFDPPIGGSLRPLTFPFVDSGATATEATTTVRTRYDIFDAVIARTYCYGDCFKVRPYGGFRCLWTRQNWRTNFTGGTATSTLWRYDFPAFGATVGFQGKYAICDGLSLVGSWGTSILGGRVEHHQDWQTTTSFRTEHRHHCQVIGGWDASVGLGYDFNCCCWPVFLSVGYEIQDWWNTAQRPRFVSAGQVTGDSASRLTVQGLYVRAGLSF